MAKVCKIIEAEERMKTEWISTYSVVIELWSLGILIEDLLKAGKTWKLLFIFLDADSIYGCKEL